MNFLYAVNNASVLSAEVVKKTGLGDILADISKVSAVTSTIGPGGDRCLLFGNIKAAAMRFKPEEQQWVESFNKEYWVGFYIEDPPATEDLAKETQLSGHEVKLGNDGLWLIPVARKFAEGAIMPLTLGIGSKGEIITKTIAEYIGFSGRAEKYYHETMREVFELNFDKQITTEEKVELAFESIMLNYHVGFEEIFALDLINTLNLREVCEAVIDVPTLNEVTAQMAVDKKKTVTAVISD